MATIVAAAGGGNWSATGTWVGGVVPTATSDVQLTSTSGNVTIDVASACRSLDCTGYTGTLTHATAVTLSVGDATPGAGNIAVKLVAGMTYTLGNSVSSGITFVGAHTTEQTIDFGGKSHGGCTFGTTANTVPKWKLLSASTHAAATGNITHNRGTIDTNDQTVSWGNYSSPTAFSNSARTLTLGASAVTIKGTSGTPWNIAGTPFTLNAGTSTITLSDTGATGKTFAGAGLTYNNLAITTGGAGAWTFTGSNTFTRLSKSGATAKSIIFTAATTTTLTGGPDAFFSGAAGNLITITSTAAGSAFTVSKASGLVVSDYLSLKDSTATGGATFYAGANSTNVSGNTGWIFAAVRSLTVAPRAYARHLLRR